ncbi:MAG: 50S ribosomal protein L1 [Acidilobaceae archaeon]
MPVDEAALREAIRKSVELGEKRRFKQRVEMIITLTGLDMKSQEAKLREVLTLPRGAGKELKVCVVAEGDTLLEARKLGVEAYGREELQAMDKKAVKRLASRCDWVLVRADLMGLAGKVLGPALGPRGKAPTPLPPNVSLAALMDRYKRSVWVRLRNQPQIACAIGTEGMSVDDLTENAKAVLSLVESKLGAQRIGKVIFKKTMSPPVTVSAR